MHDRFRCLHLSVHVDFRHRSLHSTALRFRSFILPIQLNHPCDISQQAETDQTRTDNDNDHRRTVLLRHSLLDCIAKARLFRNEVQKERGLFIEPCKGFLCEWEWFVLEDRVEWCREDLSCRTSVSNEKREDYSRSRRFKVKIHFSWLWDRGNYVDGTYSFAPAGRRNRQTWCPIG